MSTTTWWPSSARRETLILPSMIRKMLVVGPDCRSSGLSCTPQCWSRADARGDLRVLSEVQIPWGWLQFCLLQLRLFLIRLVCWRAGFADCLDTANLENRAGACRVGRSSDSHLMAHMFGETFRRKAVRLQVGHRV